MNYFKYSNNSSSRSSKELVEIFNAVHSLEKYAKSIYKGRWEDVLDRAFFHIVRNYNSSKGGLENYTIRVVRGIGLGDFKKECPTEFIEDLKEEGELEERASDNPNKSRVESELFYTNDDNRLDTSVERCVKYLAPYYIKDFYFFSVMESSKRKESYSDLFKKFNYATIRDAVGYLNSKYKDKVSAFWDFKKSCMSRKAGRDKIEKSIDSSIMFIERLNNTIFYKKTQGKSDVAKYFYEVDIPNVVCDILHNFYMFGDGSVEVEGVTAYLSLRGEILFDIEEAVSLLETDIRAFILSSAKFKVLNGDRLYFVSNKEFLSPVVEIKVFNETYSVVIKSLTSKVKKDRVVYSGGLYAERNV